MFPARAEKLALEMIANALNTRLYNKFVQLRDIVGGKNEARFNESNGKAAENEKKKQKTGYTF